MSAPTDRELLELAAKAAGLKPGHARGEYAWHPALDCLSTLDEKHRESPWNPLADDGDALRLAVKLDLYVESSNEHKFAFAGLGKVVLESESGGQRTQEERVRRAIVRAAASIGKEMP